MNRTHNHTHLQREHSLNDAVLRSISEPAAPSDHELAQSIGQGNTSSIGALYERHKPRVYSLCLRMTGNTAEAEDLTQEVFMQLLGKAGSFRGESQFTTWLYRFTTNHVLMYFRRRTRRLERFPVMVDDLDGSPSMKYSLGATLMEGIALDAAVSQLPSRSRSFFLKFDVEGFSHREIAEILGCSEGNSKSQLHKAQERTQAITNSEEFRCVVFTSANHLSLLWDYNLRRPISLMGAMP